ncbi:putative toxin-antitoxin system toxin component, PIN family [Oleiagrimonas sp.]|jgi:putative PIN family toxin of toxin-antitoxin system|uniref:putative toxin-antitoxin system toxin component, PIN family n=1 Tax=Oleiagrimonas sp. TaxID=2010330 RepID=UPI0026263B83|nr:putative toxin-antitoxin system toxin component, PIN family [Oleiagrimonas sp.]MDA3914092.1 putative toxin-antitoxin system toxin component, PIN family [Oleiagrimonas sp.]
MNHDVRPQPPEKPLPSDCCGGGCIPCILDVHEDELEAYWHSLEQWLARNPPESQLDAEAPSAGVERMVLDTNVVLDLLIFRDAGCEILMAQLQQGACRAITRSDCRDEFIRVLQYPQLALAVNRRVQALEAFDALHDVVPPMHDAPGAGPGLPQCSDPDDQKFLEVASAAGVDTLLSKDKAVLKVARGMRRAVNIEVLSPQAWKARHANR